MLTPADVEIFGETMPEIKIVPLIKSLIIALIFFVLGRLIVIQMGTAGMWLTVGLVVVFYTAWWILYRRRTGKRNQG